MKLRNVLLKVLALGMIRLAVACEQAPEPQPTPTTQPTPQPKKTVVCKRNEQQQLNCEIEEVK